MPSTFAYWNTRGFAQPIRLLLTYVGEDFEDKIYTVSGSPPKYDTSNWLKEKHSHNLDFPNLPYYIDEKVRLTHSLAILCYLARKYNLGIHCKAGNSEINTLKPRCIVFSHTPLSSMVSNALIPLKTKLMLPGYVVSRRVYYIVGNDGNSEEEKIRIDLTYNQIKDLRDVFFNMCRRPDYEQLKDEFIKKIPETIQPLSVFLGENTYFAGNNLTYPDFLAYEYFYALRFINPDALDNFPNLLQYYERFEALPRLSDYIKTAPASKYPLNMKMAEIMKQQNKT